jgi:CheY-like chemotaxis protein
MKQSGQDNGEQHSILLVDDDVLMRQFLSFLLLEGNYIVHEAINGKEALSIYNRHAPDLVLTDVDMPEINGVELTALIRQSNPNIPVIVMSANQKNLRLAEDVGANMTILKPINISFILNIIADFLL